MMWVTCPCQSGTRSGRSEATWAHMCQQVDEYNFRQPREEPQTLTKMQESAFSGAFSDVLGLLGEESHSVSLEDQRRKDKAGSQTPLFDLFRVRSSMT